MNNLNDTYREVTRKILLEQHNIHHYDVDITSVISIGGRDPITVKGVSNMKTLPFGISDLIYALYENNPDIINCKEKDIYDFLNMIEEKTTELYVNELINQTTLDN